MGFDSRRHKATIPAYLIAAVMFGGATLAYADNAPPGPVGLTLKTILQADTTMIGQPIRKIAR